MSVLRPPGAIHVQWHRLHVRKVKKQAVIMTDKAAAGSEGVEMPKVSAGAHPLAKKDGLHC